LHKFQKATDQAAIFKKEASEEHLRRIESERMVNLEQDLLKYFLNNSLQPKINYLDQRPVSHPIISFPIV